MQAKRRISAKNRAPVDGKACKNTKKSNSNSADPDLLFLEKLSSDNHPVKLAQLVPWRQFEDRYCAPLFQKGRGPMAFSVRMALAALINKERSRLSDDERVEQTRENPYLRVPRTSFS